MKRILSALGLFTLTIVTFSLLQSCKGGKKADSGSNKSNIVYAHAMSDPDMLNPINLSSTDGREIAGFVFMSMLGTDPDNYSLTPALAVARPTQSIIEEGPMKGFVKLDYEIRPEATWDNGTPVLASDYIFTIKCVLNPKTNCMPLKPYYDWLYDVVPDSTNPRKFSVISKEKYYMVEEFSGYYVLPQYVYDPEKLMDKFTVLDLANEKKRNEIKDNPDLNKFADQFNSEKFQREKAGVIGCGPYEFESWETGQKITLVRKKNWWGDKIKNDRGFLAIPDKIIYKVINDPNTATTALKDLQIDAYHGLQPKQYEELLKNESVKDKLNLQHPPVFAYTFIGFNMKNPKLSDVKVRQAIAHSINKKEINTTIGYDRSTITETFVHNTQKHYNKDIKPFEYNLDAARKLLDEAGWKDTDGDGFRDKVINGEKTKLVIDFKVPSGNKAREQTCILIKEDLKKVGIDATITARDWPVYLQDMDNKNFEATYGGFSISAIMSDPKQQWHTSSAVTGGSNSYSYGNAKTDAMIEDIRSELDEAKRVEKYKVLQQVIHDDVPCVFMFIAANRMGINKKFEVKTTLLNPGFLYNEFKVASAN